MTNTAQNQNGINCSSAMETTLSPPLSAPRFSSFITANTKLYEKPTKHVCFLSPLSKSFHPKLTFHTKKMQINCLSASSSSSELNPSPQLAVLLEVDGYFLLLDFFYVVCAFLELLLYKDLIFMLSSE